MCSGCSPIAGCRSLAGLGAAGALSSGYSHPADCKVLKEVEKGPWVQLSHHLQSGARGCTGSHGGRPKSFGLGLGFLDILPGFGVDRLWDGVLGLGPSLTLDLPLSYKICHTKPPKLSSPVL